MDLKFFIILYKGPCILTWHWDAPVIYSVLLCAMDTEIGRRVIPHKLRVGGVPVVPLWNSAGIFPQRQSIKMDRGDKSSTLLCLNIFISKMEIVALTLARCCEH